MTMEKKNFLLPILLIQNTSLALFVKASRQAEGPKYFDSTVVLLNEIIKFLVCFFLYWKTDRNTTNHMGTFLNELTQPYNIFFMVPCIIYAIQNRIALMVLDYIDATLYQVLSNLKIITTAFFAMMLLRKSLHRIQWWALILLAAGATLAETSSKKVDASSGEVKGNALYGVILMIIYACLSGFAEKMFKANISPNMTFYIKQMMLYFWGIGINGVMTWYQDGASISEYGFFHGYGWLPWTVVFVMSLGGLLVASVITYFDNITKVYLTCISIFTTAAFSYFIFGFSYSIQFMLAVIIVCISILLYNDPVTRIPESSGDKLPVQNQAVTKV